MKNDSQNYLLFIIHKIFNLTNKQMTISKLMTIASSDGSVIVDAEIHTISNLQSLTCAGRNTSNASKLAISNCQAIATANPGNITFDFKE